MTASAAERGQAGFTVVELLVAIALLGLVTAALFGSLRFGISAWGSGTAHADRNVEVLSIQNFLRRTVGDAYPLFLRDEHGQGQVDFDGEAERLSFLAPTPIALGSAGRSRFEISIDRRSARTDMIIITRPELSGDPSASVRRILIPEVRSLQFSYFGAARSDKVGRWHSEWREQTTLPSALAIQITFPERDQRVWPELVVAPRIIADVGCVLDTLTHRCAGR